MMQGLRNSWNELWTSIRNWRQAAAGQPAQRASASKRRRFEAVSKVIQQLPVEVHCSEEDLRELPLSELKV